MTAIRYVLYRRLPLPLGRAKEGLLERMMLQSLTEPLDAAEPDRTA
jgi:hypothetical protein